VDPKAKKDPKAGTPTNFTEEEETKFDNRILYQIGDSTLLEEPQLISFALKCCYQGPDIEDTTPVEEDPKAKAKAASKGAEASIEQPSIRYISPEPIELQQESGRTFQFELGRMEKNLTQDHTQEEVDELNEASQIIPEEFYEEKWVRY
jgi:hypothetical protein